MTGGPEEPPSAEGALATTWAAELLTTRDTVDARKTLRPPSSEEAARAAPTAERELPPIAMGAGELEPRGVLGTGGMAVVERAWQRSLEREVAVKRSQDARPTARALMVREARVVGSLEHPNIIPVHALGRDESGQTVIVMKRVSGRSWRELLHDPADPSWAEGDPLLRNLEILGQVCRALELAHSRGWLHRDLKTENVMIGEFGEVYVLDWGIAVTIALAERGEATFAGTPAYMAPEMAAGARLSVQTDVYLLGGILHEILTHEALNQADTLRAILDAARTPRERTYGDDVPPELAAIAMKATAYHAEDRYPDVASLRRAIARFLVHRSALDLAERASARLDAIEAGAVEDPRAERVEARASLRQSLTLFEDNPRARSALDRCLRGLVEQELEEGNPTAAARWAAQLTPPDAALDARIEAVAAALAAEARELETLRAYAADQDLAVSARARGRRSIAFGVFVLAVASSAGFALRAGWFALGYRELTTIQVVVTAAAVVMVLAQTHKNRIARAIGHSMIIAALTPFPVMLATWRLGLPAEASLGVDLLVKAGGAVIVGVLVDRAFVAVGVLDLVLAAVLLAFPATYPLEIAGSGLALALLLVGVRFHLDAARARAG